MAVPTGSLNGIPHIPILKTNQVKEGQALRRLTTLLHHLAPPSADPPALYSFADLKVVAEALDIALPKMEDYSSIEEWKEACQLACSAAALQAYDKGQWEEKVLPIQHLFQRLDNKEGRPWFLATLSEQLNSPTLIPAPTFGRAPERPSWVRNKGPTARPVNAQPSRSSPQPPRPLPNLRYLSKPIPDDQYPTHAAAHARLETARQILERNAPQQPGTPSAQPLVNPLQRENRHHHHGRHRHHRDHHRHHHARVQPSSPMPPSVPTSVPFVSQTPLQQAETVGKALANLQPLPQQTAAPSPLSEAQSLLPKSSTLSTVPPVTPLNSGLPVLPPKSPEPAPASTLSELATIQGQADANTIKKSNLLNTALEAEKHRAAQIAHSAWKVIGVATANAIDLAQKTQLPNPGATNLAHMAGKKDLKEVWEQIVVPAIHEQIDKAFSTNQKENFDRSKEGPIEKAIIDFIFDPLLLVPLGATEKAAATALKSTAKEVEAVEKALMAARKILIVEKAEGLAQKAAEHIVSKAEPTATIAIEVKAAEEAATAARPLTSAENAIKRAEITAKHLLPRNGAITTTAKEIKQTESTLAVTQDPLVVTVPHKIDSVFQKALKSIHGEITNLKLQEIENSLKDWLGEEIKHIKNKAGDSIFLSKDSSRRIRFDINNPHGDRPHMHIEKKVNEEWLDAVDEHRIYPSGKL